MKKADRIIAGLKQITITTQETTKLISEKGRPDYCWIETTFPFYTDEFWFAGEKGRPDYCGIETINGHIFLPDPLPVKKVDRIIAGLKPALPAFVQQSFVPSEKGRPDYCGIETIKSE